MHKRSDDECYYVFKLGLCSINMWKGTNWPTIVLK